MRDGWLNQSLWGSSISTEWNTRYDQIMRQHRQFEFGSQTQPSLNVLRPFLVRCALAEVVANTLHSYHLHAEHSWTEFPHAVLSTASNEPSRQMRQDSTDCYKLLRLQLSVYPEY